MDGKCMQMWSLRNKTICCLELARCKRKTTSMVSVRRFRKFMQCTLRPSRSSCHTRTLLDTACRVVPRLQRYRFEMVWGARWFPSAGALLWYFYACCNRPACLEKYSTFWIDTFRSNLRCFPASEFTWACSRVWENKAETNSSPCLDNSQDDRHDTHIFASCFHKHFQVLRLG